MDLVTYALCKKLVKTASTGIKNITYDELTDELIFTMADGSTIKVTIHIKEDCASFKFVSSLPPIEEAVENTVYLVPENNLIYQYMVKNNLYVLIGKSGIEKATAEKAGIVQPDNTSIIVNDGVISVSKTYLDESIEDQIDDSIKAIDNNSIDSLFN